ncbi:unnamed protein product [Phytomonas sp. Hart1]|nr:unnamed protein product [Phytomonas sp. Hart1]|eukprot:CCW65906.1 unnamed protein product [Phytomonas sp. isolate Hart1]
MRPVKYEVYESGFSHESNHCVNSSLIGVPFEGEAYSVIPFENTVVNLKPYQHANTQRIPRQLVAIYPHIFLSETEHDFWIRVFDTEALLNRARHCYNLCENETRDAHHFFSNHSSIVEYSNLDDLETELKQLLELSTSIGLEKGSSPSIQADTMEILSFSELTNSVETLFSILQKNIKDKSACFTAELIYNHYPISLLLDKFEEIINSIELHVNLFCTTAASLSSIIDDINKAYMIF